MQSLTTRRAIRSLGRVAPRVADVWRPDPSYTDAQEPAASAAPGDLGGLGPGLTVRHAADGLRTRIKAEAADLGGPSTLLQYVDVPEAGIEITKAHPGSLPQFITGRSTLLSGLFRDEVALRTARIAAERLTAKNLELRTVRGIEAVHLAVGLASWRIGGVQYTAPVLLRPLAIRRHQTDFELKLHGAFQINPELVRAAAEQFGIVIDGPALAALAQDSGVFKPQPVIDHLRRATAHLDTFTVHPRLVVSAFADVASAMVHDGGLEHPILNALAGHVDDRERLRSSARAVVVEDTDQRNPASDTNLLDADAEQERILARIAAGQSIAIATLPGTGGTQTIINAVGALVADGKRVLIVSARRSTLDGIRHRFGRLGLDGLGTTPGAVRKDLIRAIARNEKATPPKVAEIDEALVRLRAVLIDYRTALRTPNPDFGVSALDATAALAALMRRTTPLTSTRLDGGALKRLASGRTDAADKLVLAARLGEFRFGPDDSPWYGVSFSTTEAATSAHQLAGRLHKRDVASLLERGYDVVGQTKMRPFLTIDELGEYLRLLQGIKESLDKFNPTVFERSLSELIVANGGRRDRSEMSSATRRRLKNLAREYVRPGVHVGDMHEALTKIQQQRTQWQRYVEQGAVPQVPVGLTDVSVAWQRVNADLGQLDTILGRGGAARLGAMPVAQLVRTLAGLAAESKYFDNLVERAELRTELARLGLEPLLEELSVRHVSEDRVVDELEFTWWQSVLEHLLQHDRRLLGANTAVVDRLERDFRLVDEAHNAASGPLLAARLATQWRIGIVDHADEATALKRALTRGPLDAAEFTRAAPHLASVLAPVWAAAPYDVPALGEQEPFDTVIIADAAAINLTEAAPAIRRAKQVVLVGDPLTQAPAPFTIATAVTGEWEAEEEFDRTSVFERLAELVPVETLTQSYRAGGEDLAELVNDAFYGGEIRSLPWAGSYLGRGSLSVDYVEGGVGAPDPDSGAVESPDAEVARVVSLVVEHAVHRPRESLMVITASPKHAERVRSAVATAFAGRADVADFVSRDSGEPFAVLTLEESVAESRDRVVFSLGFGLTKHGRVLSDFGDLSTPDGERLLTVGMTRARRSMVIVSCIRPDAFEEGRLEHGAATLMGILAGVADRSSSTRTAQHADPLMRSLAQALRAMQIDVDVDYRGTLPLVAKHGGKAVVVESDPEVHAATLRESLRMRPQALRRLGWHYVRVHAFDLYTDPAQIATRVAGLLGVIPDGPVAGDHTAPIDLA